MGTRRSSRSTGEPVLLRRALPLVVVVLVLFGIAMAAPSLARGPAVSPQRGLATPGAQNSSSDPSSSGSSVLCPGAGPVILGVEWTCVAVLDLTEIIVILVSIGIVAYVFRDSDRAELPGDSAEVPITAAEWEEYQRAKKEGRRYTPPPPRNPGGGG
ncbi:MAG: hypothetical protein WB809_04865 [Thermoplasmata archaeon]